MTLKIKLIALSFFFSFSLVAQSGYEIVLETNFDGEVVSGSKEKLIEEIRKGKAVRIGWQLDFNEDKEPDFDHWAPAEFITILENDVFTQIRNINAQIPNIDIPQIDIIPNNMMWTAILGTNGLMKNRFVYEDLKFELDDEGKAIITEKIERELEIREVMTWKVATFWSIQH